MIVGRLARKLRAQDWLAIGIELARPAVPGLAPPIKAG